MQNFTDFTHYTIPLLYVSKHGFHNNFISKEMRVIHIVIMKVLGKETMESGMKRRIRSGRRWLINTSQVWERLGKKNTYIAHLCISHGE